jgi:hydrogenase nickel incorporation protein HypB
MFIGNGGSLVYPSSYDFGEDSRFLLLSVTAGEDQPAKYPANLPSADVTIIIKPDLADAVECEGAAAGRNIQDVRPGIEVSRPSAKRSRPNRIFGITGELARTLPGCRRGLRIK